MASAMNDLNPKDYVITRKRKKYKFALFHNNPLCFELENWQPEFTPAVLEIGAGTGLFCVAQAENAPSLLHLAIDVKADRLQKGAKVATDKSLSNIRFLRARVEQLEEIIPPHSISTIWITFPDPQPQDSREKKRLTFPAFLNRYKLVLKPGGRVNLKTDNDQLYAYTCEKVAELSLPVHKNTDHLYTSDLVNEVLSIKTYYEKKYLLHDKNINYIQFSFE